MSGFVRTAIHIFIFTTAGGLLGTDDTRFECTVDGIHPTDLGFMRMAGKLTPLFKQLLQHELA